MMRVAILCSFWMAAMVLAQHPDEFQNATGTSNGPHLRAFQERLDDQASSKFIENSVPSWEELDRRPLPPWYDMAKFGIFVHWGVFSVPALCSEWFGTYWRDHWGPCPDIGKIMNQTERPNFAYQEFAPRFQAELFNATEWSEVFAQAGAQYVVLTSKHHDGYCMWDSRSAVPTTWHWNVMDVGPRRDLLGELASAIQSTHSPYHNQEKLKFGVYHSLYEWFNPLYLRDRENNFTTNDFVTLKTIAELKDLVEKYKPEIIWSDGEWEASSDYWKSRDFLQWYAKTVETGVWNDRWGKETLCKHGGFYTCADRYEPGHLVQKKWENAMTIDKTSWGWNRMSSFEDYFSTQELVHTLIQTVAYNGNLLLNVGPSADGTLNPIFVDRLMGIGEWLAINSQSIFQTSPWDVCQDEAGQQSEHYSSSPIAEGVYYTRTADMLYIHLTEWPTGSTIILSCPQPSKKTEITMLGYHQPNEMETALRYEINHHGVEVELPRLTPDVIPCQHAWVLQMTHVDNLDGYERSRGKLSSE